MGEWKKGILPGGILITRRKLLLGGAASSLLGRLQNVQAASRSTVRVLVGFAAGGSSDIMARLMAERLTRLDDANYIVINKPGANGNIAAGEVARSAPDGLTLYVGSFNNPVNQAAGRKLPFDFLRDFAPIGIISYLSNVLLVRKDLPVNSVQDLVNLAKSSPKGLTFGSSGLGSSQQMAGELFKSMTGANLIHVPYSGSAPAMTDLMSGQIDIFMDNMPTALVQVRAGTVKALAVTSKRRAPQLPDLPTVAEAGLPGFEVETFFALYAPAKTPEAVIDRVNTAMNQALKDEAVRKNLYAQGAEPGGGTPRQLRTLTESEVARWRKVIQDAGLKFED